MATSAATLKEIRDLMLYGIWRTGQFKNEQIGDLFGLSYSGVSHAVRSAKLKPAKSRQLQTEFDLLNSLFKLWPCYLLKVGMLRIVMASGNTVLGLVSTRWTILDGEWKSISQKQNWKDENFSQSDMVLVMTKKVQNQSGWLAKWRTIFSMRREIQVSYWKYFVSSSTGQNKQRTSQFT